MVDDDNKRNAQYSPPVESFSVYTFLVLPILLAIMCKHDVIHKPEVHNMAQRD